MIVYIHQNIDIRCVVNLTTLVKTSMQFFTVPIPMECSRFEARNMIHLHVTTRDISGGMLLQHVLHSDISGNCYYSFFYVLISRKLLLQHVLHSDISGNCYYSMFYILISQEIATTASFTF